MKKRLELEQALVMDTGLQVRGHRILVESDNRLSRDHDSFATRKLAMMLWKEILLPSLEVVGAPAEIPECLQDIEEQP